MTIPPLTILLAEQNPLNRLIAGELLRRAGHEVHEAASGDAVLPSLEGRSFDLVFLDLALSGMDDFGLVKAVRAREVQAGRARVPLVAVSSNAEAELACLIAGMDGFVCRPLEREELALEIGRVRSGLRVLDPPDLIWSRVGGFEELLRTVLNRYLEASPALLSGLRTALEQGDGKAAAFAAHKMVGLIGTFSARAMEAFRRVEQAARDGHLDPAREWLGHAEESLHKLGEELRVLLPADGAAPSPVPE